MRRKIAKRKRKELRKLGCTFSKEEFIREPGWRRKDCGYSVTVHYKDLVLVTVGDDELECYSIALDEVKYRINREENHNGNA